MRAGMVVKEVAAECMCVCVLVCVRANLCVRVRAYVCVCVLVSNFIFTCYYHGYVCPTLIALRG